MKKNNFGYIKDILEYISHIEKFLANVEKEELFFNTEKEFAIIRSFEVIGEASKNVDKQFKLKYNHIPWREMGTFRNVSIHDYDRLVVNTIWKTAKEKLPKLKSQLLQILEDEQ